jgi:hypothetical protein
MAEDVARVFHKDGELCIHNLNKISSYDELTLRDSYSGPRCMVTTMLVLFVAGGTNSERSFYQKSEINQSNLPIPPNEKGN